MLRRLATVALVFLLGAVFTTCKLADVINAGRPGALTVDPLLILDSARVGSTAPRVLGARLDGEIERLAWTAAIAHGSSWLSLSRTSGATPDSVALTMMPAGLAPGVYRDTLVFTLDGAVADPILVPVEFRVVACGVVAITPPVSRADTLTTADCGAPHQAGSHARLYGFSAAAGDSVSVNVAFASASALVHLTAAGGATSLHTADRCGAALDDACLRYALLPSSGDYLIEVTTETPGTSGLFTVGVTRPRPPALPDILVQERADRSAVIATGGSIPEATVGLRAAMSDSDGDSLRLQIEARPVGAAFTDTPTGTGPLVANGQASSVVMTGLADDVSYHWQVRAIDLTGRTGPWRAFGGNAETAGDFVIAIPEVPSAPAAMSQSKSDGTTGVAIGVTTDEATLLVHATVGDPDPSDQVRLEVEVQPVGTAFTNAATAVSPLVARGTVATATIGGLSDNETYHWQARAVDQTGRASAWLSFGGNVESTADFGVAIAPARLAFAALPATTGAGTAMAPAVTVAVQDAAGNTLASFAGTVSVAIGSGPTGATLSGTTSVTASAGIATFTGLRINRAAAGYTLIASLGSLSSASAAFAITPGSATQLVFTAAPSGASAGVAFAPAVQVTARDSLGNTATGFTGSVTIGIGAGPAGGLLGGTLSVTAVQGVATFAGASIAKAGTGYALSASATGLAGAASSTFDVLAGNATALGVLTEPASTASSGVALTRQPIVQLRDAHGNDVSQSGIAVIATIASGPTGATLAGAATTTLGGRATFAGLAISGAPGSYRLAFSASGLVGAQSAAVQLGTGTATRLSVATQPSGSAASGVQFSQQPSVRLLDAAGNVVAQPGIGVTAAIATGGGVLGGNLTVPTDDFGVATFTDLSISGLTGSRTLTFTATGLTAAPSTTISVGPGTATQIAIHAGNGQSAVAGTTVSPPPSVLVSDASGNPVTGVPVTFSVFSGGGTIAPVAAVPTDAGGIASATSWQLGAQAGTNVARATAAGLTGSPLTFTATGTAGTATQILKSAGDNLSGPVGTTLGTAHEVTITDANGNPVMGVAVGWAAAGGGSVNPTNTTTDAQGRATTIRTLGAVAGPQTTTANATLGATPASVTFDVNATVGGATQLALSGGDNQVDTVGATLAVPLTVIARDALNNPVPGVLITWTVTDGGGSTTPTTSTTDAQGVATTSWRLGTSTSATDSTQLARATGVGTPVNFIATTRPGKVSATRSEVTASPGSIVASAGAITSTVTVTARDGFDNPIANRTVTLAASGNGNTVVQPAAATGSNGVTTGTLASSEAGPHSVSATIAGTAATTQPVVTVTSAAPASLHFTTAPAGTTAGASIPDIVVELRDAFGNRATTAANAVTLALAANPGPGTLSGTVTRNAVAGVATFPGLSIDRASAGYMVSAASGVLAGTTSGPFTISVGTISAATSTVTVTSGTVASGSATTVRLQARDASGNILSAGGASVAFTASGGTSTGTIGTTVDPDDGTYTATFTGVLAGSATTIGATIGLTAVTTALPTITVTPGPISAATSQISTSGSSVPSGGTVTLRLRARDAAGNLLTSGLSTVAFTATNGAAGTIGAVTDSLNGVYVATFTGVTAGTTSIGAMIGTATVTTPSAGITVTVGGAANTTSLVSVSNGTVASGSGITLTLSARDAAGNALSTGGDDVVFSASGGGSTGIISGTSDPNTGTYTATFTGVLAGSATTIRATLNGNLVTSTQAVTVIAGPISTTGSVVQVSAASVASGSNVTLTLLARDDAGNAIGTGGQTVAFTRTGGTSTGTISGTSDPNTGSYTATFTGVVAGSATTIGATIGSNPVTSTLPTVAVTPGPISAATSVITVGSGSVASGSSVTLTLTARDAAGNALGTGGASVAFGTSGGTSSGVVSGTSDPNTGSYTASFTGVGAGTATTITATIDNVAVTSALPTVQVTPGTISTAQSTVSVSSATVPSGGTVVLRLDAKDAVGNAITSGGETVTFTFSGGTSTGTIGATTDSTTGVYTAVLTGANFGTASQVTAFTNNNAVTSATPDVTVTALSQSITFAAPATPAEYGSTFGVAPTASSGLAVTVTPSGGCTISSGTVTMTSGTASCVLTASQPGDNVYSAASDVAHTVAASPRPASVTPDPATKVFGAADPVLAGTLSGFLASDGVTATYTRVAGENAGSYTISASLSATGSLADYAVTSNTASFTIMPATQTITFAAPATPAPYGSTFDVTPTASSGLTVTVTPGGGCSISGATVTMTSGTVDCVLTASQAGDANYQAATDVAHTVVAALRPASVTPDAAGKTFGAADPVLTGTLSGFLAADGVAATYSRTAGESVGGYVISASLTGALANYSVTSNTTAFTISQAPQTITFAAPASPTQYGATFDVTPTASSGLTVTVTPTGGCSISGVTVTMTSGTVDCVLTASQAGDASYLAATDVAHTIVAALRPASVTPDAAGKTFGASDPVLTGTLSGFLVADGVAATYSRTAGENAGLYVISASLTGSLANYSVTSNTTAFTISQASQTITFAAPATPAQYGSTFDVTPTASSGLTVTVTPAGGCSISGVTVAMTSGTVDCVLTASQAGNGDYLAATDVVHTIVAALRPAAVTPDPAGKTFGASDPVLTGTLSGFLVADGVAATYSRTAGEDAGAYVISASLTGSLANYSITSNTATFTISQASQTITFAAPATPAQYGATFDVTPTASSGLTVTITPTGGCSISGATVTMTSGTVDCVLTASQGGDGNYLAAADVVHTVVAALRPASVTPNDAGKAFGAADPALTGTLAGFLVADGVAAAYSRSAGEAVGTYVISASLTGSLANYSVTSNTATFTISQASQTITFAAPATPAQYGSTFDVTPTASSGLTVTVTPSGGCSISGATVTMTSGTVDCVLTASQGGDGNYLATADVVHTVVAALRPASVTPDDAGKIFGAADPVLTGTLSGFLVADGVAATYSRTAGENAGAYAISASLTGLLANYSVTSNTATFTISQASQAAVTLTVPPNGFVGQTGLVAVGAGGSGTGALTYGTTTSAVCTVDANTGDITAVDMGTCTITATRAADANYLAESSGPGSFTVAGPAAALFFTVSPPSTRTAGQGFDVTVTARDANGNVALGFGGTVSLATTGGGPLVGATPTAATSGVVSFTSISIQVAGNGYQIVASTSGLTDVASSTIDVSAGNAHHLTFTTPPANMTAGTTFAVALELRDAFENVKTNFDSDVTLGISGVTLNGDVVNPTVSGVVSFPGLSITQAGTGYRILADFGFGVPQLASGLFDVAPDTAATTTSTLAPPSSTVSLLGTNTATITLQLKDAFGNNLTTAGPTPTFQLSSGIGESQGTFDPPVYAGNGAWTVVFTGTQVGTPATITAFLNGNAVAQTVTVEVQP